jgi:uncharacterized Ntn-hydrolase superfamily protein
MGNAISHLHDDAAEVQTLSDVEQADNAAQDRFTSGRIGETGRAAALTGHPSYEGESASSGARRWDP